MQKLKSKKKDKHEEQPETVEAEEVETADVSDLLENIDEVLESSKELRDSLSGCTDESLEAALKLRYDEYEAELDKLGPSEIGWENAWARYKDDRDQIYRAFNTTRQELIDRLGCGCSCPTWI